MKVVLAPDSFKGSLTANEVCAAMRRGILRSQPDARIVELPIGDGGEGTMPCLVQSTSGWTFEAPVHGPMGEERIARYGILGNGRTAVVECAEAAGLTLIPEDKRNPGVASTYGVGELILAALSHDGQTLIVCLGGSATQDGGAGMLQALGARFLNEDGKPLSPGGTALAQLHHIDWTGLDSRLSDVQVFAACDVDTPLCGPRGTSPIFAPQKGADDEMVKALSLAMDNYAAVSRRTRQVDIANVPGGGAAGGLGAGLLLAANATLKRGIDIVLDTIRFSDAISTADVVFTGEGRLDGQSVLGKTIWGVSQRAKGQKVPVVALVGGVGPGYEMLYDHGLTAAFSIINQPMTLKEASKQAPILVEDLTHDIMRLLVAGTGMGNRG